MLNIYFGLFMLGMLISLCYKAFKNLTTDEEAEELLTDREFALLIALAIGVLIAFEMGAREVYRTSVLESWIF